MISSDVVYKDPPPGPTEYQRARITEFAFMCEKARVEGEHVLDVALRLLILAAVDECETQLEAARMLGVSNRMLIHHLRKYGYLKRDRRARDAHLQATAL